VNQKVLITGVSGFVGKELWRHLSSLGYEIIGVSRRAVSGLHAHRSASLGESIKDFLEEHKPQAIIHCAHDFTDGTQNPTVQGTLLWEQEARATGIEKQIFISSISADESNSTQYGDIKRELESHFLKQGHTCIRPGLVIGDGGMFKSICRLIEKLPIVPIIGGSDTQLYVIHISDLSSAAQRCLQNAPSEKLIQLYYGNPVRLKALAQAIAAKSSLNRIFLSVPNFIAYWGAKFLELFISNPPIKASSILSLKQNSQMTSKSNIQLLRISDRSLDKML
jgi:nucleoside-diphosphate-sugar epimerase